MAEEEMVFDPHTQTVKAGLPEDLRRRSIDFNVFQYFLKRLGARCQVGQLSVTLPDGQRIAFQAPTPGPEAVVVLRHWRAVRRLITGGDIGFAESYIDGDWTSPDLVAVMELAARNLDALDREILPSWPAKLLNRVLHWLRGNTRRGSRRNIAAHYDLGNDFYGCWLDPGMSYSSALYRQPSQTLEAAQTEKQNAILDQLELTGGERVLEIGCGWGGLAERLIERGCHVTGLTLSQEQLDYTLARLEKAGISHAADIRLEDYRDTEGTFDRIVSVEMLEAVGQEYWPTYFRILRERLAPGGTIVLQVITIDERRFDGYVSNVDFIQRYIFPGGMLPTRTHIERETIAAGLRLESVEAFGESYARTLAEWRRRFLDAYPAIAALGFPSSFKRMWEYYLAYCEAGFRAGTVDVAIYRLTG